MPWAVVNAVSLAMAAQASTSSQVDGLCSTLKTSRVCHSRFSFLDTKMPDARCPTFLRLALLKNMNDRKIVQISAGHSIALQSIRTVRYASCAFPSTPTLASARTRIYLCCKYVLVWGCAGYCRLGLGNHQDTPIPNSSPLSRAIGKSPAARLSTPGRRTVPSLFGAGVLVCRQMEDLWRWECWETLERFPIRTGYHVSGRKR